MDGIEAIRRIKTAQTEERPSTPDRLTQRELEVLKLIAQGLGNQEIADALVVSVATVYTHVSRILDKLHLASRTQAALYALREGLASLYDDAGSGQGPISPRSWIGVQRGAGDGTQTAYRMEITGQLASNGALS